MTEGEPGFFDGALGREESTGVHAAVGRKRHHPKGGQPEGTLPADPYNIMCDKRIAPVAVDILIAHHVAAVIQRPQHVGGSIDLKLPNRMCRMAPVQRVAKRRNKAHERLADKQMTLPRTDAVHPILVVRVGDDIKFLVQRRLPSAVGAPVVARGVDAVAMAGNPAAVGGEHIDVVDAEFLLKRTVPQCSEGVSAVGAEGQQAVLRTRPHTSSLAPPRGVEPFPFARTPGRHRIVPQSPGHTQHSVVQMIAHSHRHIAVEGSHTFERDAPPAVFRRFDHGAPRRVDIVGTIEVSAGGTQPQRPVGSHGAMKVALHTEVGQPVALLSRNAAGRHRKC